MKVDVCYSSDDDTRMHIQFRAATVIYVGHYRKGQKGLSRQVLLKEIATCKWEFCFAIYDQREPSASQQALLLFLYNRFDLLLDLNIFVLLLI